MIFIYYYTRPNAGVKRISVERTSVERKQVLNRSNTAFQQGKTPNKVTYSFISVVALDL